MLTHPSTLARAGSESAHQQAFFAFCAFAENNGIERALVWAKGGPFLVVPQQPFPGLHWIHSSGNGAMLGDTAKARAMRAARMKTEGLKPGVSDIFFPYPHAGRAGLYIELKRPDLKPKRAGSKGPASEEQNQFIDYANSVGYKAVLCYGWEEAADALVSYLRGC